MPVRLLTEDDVQRLLTMEDALEGAHVNIVPGAAFGAEGYARLSYATSREQLRGGLDRLEQLLRG